MAGLVGAGRSEVAQAIFGVDPALAGTLTLDGQTLRVRSPRDAIRQGIYLAPEDRRRSGLIVDMTIRDNVTMPSLSRYAPGGLIQKGPGGGGGAERPAARSASKLLRSSSWPATCRAATSRKSSSPSGCRWSRR